MLRPHLLMCFIICIFIPGGSLLLSRKYWYSALFIPIIGFAWVGVFSLSRTVVTPMGFMSMVIGLLLLHSMSYLIGLAKFRSQGNLNVHIKRYGLLALLCGLNIAIALGCHWNKDRWFGFAFYHIPSSSMYPALSNGDFILADTWYYSDNAPNNGDIVIFERKNTLFIKRIFASAGEFVVMSGTVANRVQYQKNSATLAIDKNSIFVLGDNRESSQDSRHYGTIDVNNIVAKARFHVLSIHAKLNVGQFGAPL